MISLVYVTRNQVRSIRVRTRYENRGHAHNVGSKSSRNQLLNEFLCWDQDFSAHVSAFLCRSKLILEVNSGGARFDHCLHQLKCIEVTAEASLRVCNDRSKPESIIAAFSLRDLVGPLKCLVNLAYDVRHAVSRI